jgi:flagella basal body P-ring formation protein FlgA
MAVLAVALLLAGAAFAGPRTALVPGSALRAAVDTFALGIAPGPGRTCAVECRALPESIRVPSGTIRVRVEGSATPVLRAHVPLVIEISVDGATVRRIIVSAFIRTWATVLCAARPLDARATVSEGDVREEKVETTTWNRRPLEDVARLAGLRTRRMIAEGTPLSEDMMEPVPLVVHGAPVTLRATSGGVTVSVPAVALEDGAAGSIITVRAAHAHERFRARVAGPGIVEVVEE